MLNFKICHDDNEQKRKLEITERIELYNLEIIRSIGEKELKNLWNLKIMVIRIVVRLYGTATKYLGKKMTGLTANKRENREHSIRHTDEIK